MILQRTKKGKRILFASIFIFSMVLVNTLILSDFIVDVNNNQQHDWSIDENTILTSDIDPYLTDYVISGTGVNQEVRIYALNNSFSNENNENSFNIPSMSTTESTYLTYGNFNFTFQNNYTTDYIIEDTNALEAADFIKFVYNEDTSSMSINTGNNLNPPINFDKLVDGLPSTYIELESSGGILNFTISSNFTSTIYDGSLFDVNFNRSLILGLISKFSCSLNNSAYLTLKMRDISDSSWINVTDRMFINSSLIPPSFEDRFVNENLNYINASDVSQIQFYLQNYDSPDFILTLEEFEMASTYGFDLPITSSNQVALEFDLKGKNSNVNGFYAWIRTLNLTKALTAELNITLYEANATIARTSQNLIANNLEPDTAKLIDSQIFNYTDYHGDSLSYFEFNPANTQNLGLSNYFIVITANQENVFSLVTIPRERYGDLNLTVDHQLRTSSNSGLSWNVARKQVIASPTYDSQILDAAAFKLNVTRAYMPSDFENPYDSQDTLKIQDIPIIDQKNNDPPYDTSSSLEWGLGQWDYNFTTSIANDPSYNFQIDLTWNSSVIQGFNFNVTYTVKGYWIEQANSAYRVSYDTTPIWELNYTLNTGYKNFDNWNLLEFWYLFPSDYTAKNLTNPNSVEIYENVVNETGGEKVLPNQPSYEFISVSNDIINDISGIYSLNFTSSNLINDMNSYINYNDILWKTNGFMYGDNISVRLDISDPNSNPPISGNASVLLFYPNNSTKVPGAELNNGSGVINGNSLIYDFNNQSIYDVTNAIPVFGNYYLGFFWENGSAIGCQKLKLYIDKYDISMNNLLFDPTLNQNILDGIVDHQVYDEYSRLISTVNVTDDKYYPSFYAVNKTDINQELIHTVGDEDIPIVIDSFLQNETILNPNENIRVSTRIQNKHDFIDIKLRVNVQLVSLVNEEWIIAEQTTDLKTLKPSIDPNGEDTQDFSVDIAMPTLLGDGIWHGVNAPIRKGGAKTRVTVFIEYGGESYEIDTYESNEYALIINSTEDVFEGYIIALKLDNDITTGSITKPFERDECQYLPNQTTFIINVYDRNYISSYNQFIASFSLKINSDFSEIQTQPQAPIYGQSFNISSVLKTELGDIIPNKNVTCQFYDNGIWENISSQISDVVGITNFEIDTLSLPSDDEFKFRLTWRGDQYTLESSRNVTILLYRALNGISLDLRSNQDQIFRNAQTTIQLTLRNVGDSELRVIVPSISIGILPNLTYSIVEIDYLSLGQFKPGDITVILIKIDVPAIDLMNVSVLLGVKNDITDEELTFQVSNLFEIYDVQLADYFLNIFTLFMISIFVLIWGIMYFYVKRTIKRIETPYEEPDIRKQRKGKYVAVSELPKEEIPETPPIDSTEKKSKKRFKKKKPKVEKTEEKEKPPTTDLDSLLEEKGLKD